MSAQEYASEQYTGHTITVCEDLSGEYGIYRWYSVIDGGPDEGGFLARYPQEALDEAQASIDQLEGV